MHIKLIERLSDSNNTILIIKVIEILDKAAIEDVFFNLKTKAHTKAVIKNNLACKNNSIPKKAATPLPPLNFIKIEKQWPIIMKTTKSLKIEPNNLFVINRVKKPFRKSEIKVSKADFLDPMRHIFVAPGFFDPVSKGF